MLGIGKPHRPKAVAFDIIGTTFSMEPLRQPLEDLGLPASALERLYVETVRDAMAIACAGGFAPFAKIMRAALTQLLAEQELTATDPEMKGVLERMRSLPAHPDALAAFRMLREADIRIFAVSNGAASATQALLDGAGLAAFVEKVVSIDEVKLAKPRPEIYRHAVQAAKLGAHEMMLVACHPWDVNGAKAAGLLGGYVCRGRPYPHAIMASPDVEGDTLTETARAILAMRA